VKVYSTISSIQEQISLLKSKGKTIGFVPTMGALHYGHISLVKSATSQCDITIVSVFVNPTQFNNPDDLVNYPRTLDADIELLSEIDCDLVFAPSVEEMYPENSLPIQLDLGKLAEVMEGKYRPGHFDGVVNVVNRLFEIVKPDKAFFGLKDFQQVSVIRFMTNTLKLPVEIIACPTLREASGLAMSSRNTRLSEIEKEDALIIYKSLAFAKELAKSSSPELVKKEVVEFFNQGKLVLEYFEIVNPITLESLGTDWMPSATACIVAYCGDVRLIDNMKLVGRN
jgi:pantoate--beta-alanine ligase